MKRQLHSLSFALVLGLLLVSGCAAGSDEEDDGGLRAPDNELSVPDVVGLDVKVACEHLQEGNYVGAVDEIVNGPVAGEVVAQEVPAGEKRYVGFVVPMTVTGPLPDDGLPSECVVRTDGA